MVLHPDIISNTYKISSFLEKKIENEVIFKIFLKKDAYYLKEVSRLLSNEKELNSMCRKWTDFCRGKKGKETIADKRYLFREKFGSEISAVLEKIANKSLDQESAEVRTVDEIREWKNGAVSIRREHEIEFKDPVDFSTALNIATEIIGQLNTTYQDIIALYEEYHKTAGSEEARQRLKERVLEIGFDDNTADQLVDFIVKIRPTYGQLKAWQKELKGKGDKASKEAWKRIRRLRGRYERARHKLAKRQEKEQKPLGFPLIYPPQLTLLVEDTLRDPGDPAISTTLAALFTGYCAITDYQIENKGLQKIKEVKKIVFCIGAGSQKTFSERHLGTVLQRPNPKP